jgi:hypothetical protein
MPNVRALDRRAAFLGRLNGILSGVLAPESWTLSQAFFYGSVATRPKYRRGDDPAPAANGGDHGGSPAESRIIDGWRHIDKADELDMDALGKDGQPLDPANGDNGDEPGEHQPGEHQPGDPVASIENVRAALELIANDDRPWENGSDGWNEVGMATFAATRGSELGFAAFDAWSAQSPKYDARRTHERWDHYRKSPPSRIGFGKLVWLARETDPGFMPFDGFDPDLAGLADLSGLAGDVAGLDGNVVNFPGGPPPEDMPGEAGAAPAGAPDDEIDPDEIVVYRALRGRPKPPPRDWMLGNSFCRTFVSSITGPGGVGKTTLRIAQMLALASGQPLTGEAVWYPCRVLWVCFEDDLAEIERRLQAAEKYYSEHPQLGLDLDLVAENMHFASAGARQGKLMTVEGRQGRIARAGKLAKHLARTIRRHGIDYVCLDPSVKTHGVPENDNTLMDMVATLLGEMASGLRVAIDVVAHDRKGGGEPGDAERSRGASATAWAYRLNYTLTIMSEPEAKRFEVPEDQRWRDFRYDSSKVNLCPAVRAMWFRIHAQNIANGDLVHPNGDEIGVAVRWEPPAAAADVVELAAAPRLAADRTALRELERALVSEGVDPPTVPGIPQDRQCVSLDVWRTYAIEGGISTSDKPNSRRVAFQRASERLIEAGLVGFHGEIVWLP